MITTDDDELAAGLRLARNHGLHRRQEDCETWGCNMRLDTVQAAMMLVKLDHHEGWIARRRANAAMLRQRLGGLLDLPPDRPGDLVVYQNFLAQADDRDGLAAHLAACGVGCAVHYRTPIHRLAPAAAMHLDRRALPRADRQAGRMISLPVHQDLTGEQLDVLCSAVEAFYQSSLQESTR
jgi:dTDP-4-amino-4,6-dideoxygalactose transaminase